MVNKLKIPEPSDTLMWFRRDLRLEDNAAFYHALKENTDVLPIFIFDTQILSQIENKEDILKMKDVYVSSEIENQFLC